MRRGGNRRSKLWPVSNKTFVPDSELRFSIYVGDYVPLAQRTGLGYFHKQLIFEPGEPQCENACGFLRRPFEMIVEIVTAIFLIQGATIISRLVERRHDVLRYVSNSEPRLN
jgi:hypothetical protein